MGSVFVLLIIVLLALVVVQLGTNALILTGMSRTAAQFQAASAFFGTGFTTAEAEMVVAHPVRRRVILRLIVAGNIGLTSAMATLIVTFVQQSDEPFAQNVTLAVILVLCVLALGLLFKLSFVKGPIDSLQRRIIERAGVAHPVDYEVLLKVTHGFCVSDFEIGEGHPLAGKALWESRPSDAGIVILGIYPKGEEFVGAPDKEARVEAGDTVMVYGSEEAVQKMAGREGDDEARADAKKDGDEAIL